MRIRLNLPRNEQQGCAGAAGLKRDPPLSLSRFHYYYRRIHQHAFRMPEGSITLFNLCLEFMM